MAEFHILSKPGCPYCEKAKKLLDKRRLTYTEVSFDNVDKQVAFKKMGYPSWPQIFHKGERIGGYDKLEEYLSA